MAKPKRQLNFTGPLTVAVCEAVQAEIAAALDQADNVTLGVDPEAEVDLTFLQILIAAQRSAAARGKRLALSAPPAGRFAKALKVCGYPTSAKALAQIFAPPREGAR